MFVCVCTLKSEDSINCCSTKVSLKTKHKMTNTLDFFVVIAAILFACNSEYEVVDGCEVIDWFCKYSYSKFRKSRSLCYTFITSLQGKEVWSAISEGY